VAHPQISIPNTILQVEFAEGLPVDQSTILHLKNSQVAIDDILTCTGAGPQTCFGQHHHPATSHSRHPSGSSALASPKIAAPLHQGLVRVVELGVLHRDGVEPVVFRGLDACVNVESGWGRKVISRG
jgi:hypothetical protein